MRIKEIKGQKALVESKNHEHSIDISLIKNAQIGDYILSQADMAINHIPTEEAEKILKIVNEINLEH
jgi:hydrogenase maturation factor